MDIYPSVCSNSMIISKSDVLWVDPLIAGSEECVNHMRMKELVKDHPHDISQVLHALVENGFIEREGSGSGTFYYYNFQQPMLRLKKHEDYQVFSLEPHKQAIFSL